MTLGLLLLAALALAWANGANDNLKATATLYGAGVLDYRRARRLATAAQLLGSGASVLLAEELLRAFSGKGLVPGEVVGVPIFLVAVGIGAASTVLVATRLGLPVSTTHALVGALVGAGLWMAPNELSWAALGSGYFTPLLISPALAAGLATVAYPLLHRLRLQLGIVSDTCLCIGESVEPVAVGTDGSAVLRASGRRLDLDELSACEVRYGGELLGTSVQSLVDRAHQASALALGFARGLNDTPKVLALLVAAGWSGLDPRASLAVVAFAMAAGGWLNARKVAETLAHGVTPLSHGQGFLANAVASTLVIGASLVGSPVSTTHVSSGAIFGIGLWNEETSWRTVGTIGLAWITTLPMAAALAAGAAAVLHG